MTFQEVLAEAEKLTDEEKRKLVSTLWQDMERRQIAQIFPMAGVVDIVTPTLGEGSLKPLYDLLEAAKAQDTRDA